ncbi:hypothetical protein K493DRAFT_313311 [Basidiobolus meristosporus CBS 931.73]|uniref:Large ribosomal subunit protein uL23m n=1 Tax=Basidiobolus meristosporus CBS 931.73 TaxID=1314790 RepID=A0A1Y1YMC1_9FUNG|nr:hypothetical protein K493DRAFT_313311 [Basidiobolus meristosporus CBS 931.73]|eukprot:ORX99157.1 hypothetical protein K493DRAFT_313311 [Basidiobolus meristosporus CBS 931.73]
MSNISRKIFGNKQIFFPSVIFKVVRSNLPPNQVAFRVPPKVNKLDIKDYLSHVYKLDVVNVRTVNYEGKMKMDARIGRRVRDKDWKKAIVTIGTDFEYPAKPNLDDFGKETHQEQVTHRARKLKGWRMRAPRVAPKSE